MQGMLVNIIMVRLRGDRIAWMYEALMLVNLVSACVMRETAPL